MANSRTQGPMCTTRGDYIDEGTMCRTLSPTPGPICGGDDFELGNSSAVANGFDRAAQRITNYIDDQPELKGAGVVLKLPVGDPVMIRESDHASGLKTYVTATAVLAGPNDERTWWQRWNGVVLSCGGAAVSWGGVLVSGAAEVPSLGSSTVLLVATFSSAVATTAQCGLAIAKEESSWFQQVVQGPNSKYVTYADVTLDVISLAGGIASAVGAIRSGSTLLKTSKYAAELESIPKGQLLKQLERMEKAEKDLEEFRALFARTMKYDAERLGGKIAGPSGQAISNNILKRALPLMTGRLKADVANGLSSVIGTSLSLWSSSYGGVGPGGFGMVKWTIGIYQESILGESTAGK